MRAGGMTLGAYTLVRRSSPRLFASSKSSQVELSGPVSIYFKPSWYVAGSDAGND